MSKEEFTENLEELDICLGELDESLETIEYIVILVKIKGRRIKKLKNEL